MLLRFASASDKNYDRFNQPWFVKGLIFVLILLILYFDSYSVSIGCIDQLRIIPDCFGNFEVKKLSLAFSEWLGKW